MPEPTPDWRETSDWSQLHPDPLVSVLMVTYNHAEWVAKAIEGIVSQDCPFGFELVVGEDCSSDQTLAIVLQYQARFPQLIRVLASVGNVGAAANHARVIAASRGRYLAFCEGDDYWCHPQKLRAQAGLLEQDAGIAAVHSDWVRLRKDRAGAWRVNPRRSEHARMRLRHLQGDLFPVFYSGRILRTCTLMLRRSALEAYKADPFSRHYCFEDTVMAAYLTSRWRVGYWSEVAAVYRESPNSLLRSGMAAKVRFLQSALHFDSDARAYFAARSDYPQAYRWEIATGLLWSALRAHDGAAFRGALDDMWAHFRSAGLLTAVVQTLQLRWPTLHRRRAPASAPFDAGAPP